KPKGSVMSPALTHEERSLLRKLAALGAASGLPPPLRDRLAFYGLINETPRGWVITRGGEEAINRAPTKTSLAESPAEKPAKSEAIAQAGLGRSLITGKRLANWRRSPFL